MAMNNTQIKDKGAEATSQTKSENKRECAYSSNGIPKLKEGVLLQPPRSLITTAFGLDRKGK